MRILTVCLQAFISDFLNRSAEKRQDSDLGKDLTISLPLLVTTSSAVTESTSKIGQKLLGLNSYVMILMLCAFSLLICIYVVCAKMDDEKTFVFHEKNHCRKIYLYSEFLRLLSKLVVFILFLFIPITAIDAIENYWPISDTIHGFVIDDSTGYPIENSTIIVVDPAGVNVTRESIPSDSDGFFIVSTNKGITRQHFLRLKSTDCQTDQRLSLKKPFEINIENDERYEHLEHLFKYSVQCKEKK